MEDTYKRENVNFLIWSNGDAPRYRAAFWTLSSETTKVFEMQIFMANFQEKMTDVKIAVQLLNDAQDNKFDTTFIISADSDLVPPIHAVLERYQDKRVIVALPPNRKSDQLRSIATANFTIGRKKLKDSQLRHQVKSKSGFKLRKPREWN